MRKFIKKITDALEHMLGLGGIKRDIIFLVISGVALLCSIFKLLPLPFDAAWIAIVLCGVPIVLEAIIGLVTSFDIKADVLVSIALIASICIGEDFAAGEVAFIMQLGALLEELTVARARAGIERLVRLTPVTARVVDADGEHIVPVEQVTAGATLRVLPGETVPVDGVILSGQTSINQAVMTGESLPVDKGAGDDVSSGTVNLFGSFTMRAERVGEDSSIQRMIRLVRSADADKAKIVGIADRWATWIVVLALSAAVLTWIFSGEIIRAVTIFVVFCPCALVLATPTAIMAAIGNATNHGFLVREGDALERLARVRRVAFDKTGTLTRGEPTVCGVHSLISDISDDELYAVCAAAEHCSEHPLGRAVVRCFRTEHADTELPEDTDFHMVPGRGVFASVGGREVLAGNCALLEENGIALPEADPADEYLSRGCSVIYLSLDGRFAGVLALSDTLREESRSTVEDLKSLGVTPVLLTGDRESAARAIGGQLGIADVHPECLPEDKLEYVRERRAEGEPICMIGDGVNDAPALKAADTGIAMGGVGSDIAAGAADIVLVSDEVKELPHIMALSRHMMKIIKINMTFSMALNFVAVALAITGKLSPVIGALVHNAGSVLVITNSAFLLKWKRKK